VERVWRGCGEGVERVSGGCDREKEVVERGEDGLECLLTCHSGSVVQTRQLTVKCGANSSTYREVWYKFVNFCEVWYKFVNLP